MPCKQIKFLGFADVTKFYQMLINFTKCYKCPGFTDLLSGASCWIIQSWDWYIFFPSKTQHSTLSWMLISHADNVVFWPSQWSKQHWIELYVVKSVTLAILLPKLGSTDELKKNTCLVKLTGKSPSVHSVHHACMNTLHNTLHVHWAGE